MASEPDITTRARRVLAKPKNGSMTTMRDVVRSWEVNAPRGHHRFRVEMSCGHVEARWLLRPAPGGPSRSGCIRCYEDRRAAHIARICAADPDLGREVHRLATEGATTP